MTQVDMVDADASKFEGQVEDSEDQDVAEIPDDGPGSEESDGEPFLAVTRERRSNAGNRMSKLLQLAEAEDADEQFADIFQELANDEEFEGEVDEDADVSMSSSSEDEAEGDQDEEQGEKELKKQEKQENRKKRKRETLLQQMMKSKAAKLAGQPGGPSLVSTQPEKAKKRTERISWLPDGEVRASSRKLAVKNKQDINARLKIKEKQRLKTLAVMRAAEKVKEQNKPKTLTQADRLAEAANIERHNSKTVSKWEEAERQRVAEQNARLAAMKNRRIEGPMITYYSGPALSYYDQEKAARKYTAVGKDRVEKATAKQMENVDQDSAPGIVHEDQLNPLPDAKDQAAPAQVGSVTNLVASTTMAEPFSGKTSSGAEDASLASIITSNVSENVLGSAGFLAGIHQYANIQDPDKAVPPKQSAPGKPDEFAGPGTAIDPLIKTPLQSEIDNFGSAASSDNQLPPRDLAPIAVHSPRKIASATSDNSLSSSPKTTAADTTALQTMPLNDSVPPAQNQIKVEQSASNGGLAALPPSGKLVTEVAMNVAAPGTPSHTPSLGVSADSIQPQALQIQNAFHTNNPSGLPQLSILPQTSQQQQPAQSNPEAPRAPPPKAELTSLNLVSLTNYPNLERTEPATTAKARQAERDPLMRALLAAEPSFTGSGKLKPAAPTKCSLTDRPARYRDPGTGLPYADIASLKGIRRLTGGSSRWSALLGAWVGGRDDKGEMLAAMGVPEGFLRKVEIKPDADEGRDGEGKGTAVASAETTAATPVTT